MINAKQIAEKLNIEIIESPYMCDKMRTWHDMYMNKSIWLKGRIESLELPSSIASEITRLVLTEFESSLDNSIINAQYQRFSSNIVRSVEEACAFGGVVYKPYNVGGLVMTDAVRQLDIVPVTYTDNVLTSVICPEYIVRGNDVYTRLEYHAYSQSEHTHTVRNICFHSKTINDLGRQCSLEEVEEWTNILPEKVYPNVDRPLFSYFRMPFSNNIDLDSPLGVSAFGKAEGLIKEADTHWERILWEYESSERAIDATEDLFRYQDGKPVLPKGRERMFRTYDIQTTGQPFIETFSPEIRDTSLFNGLNSILQRIEFNCGLAYGTLSDISNVEKTAEEIKTSKQRSYNNVCAIQRSLQTSLDDLAYIYGYYNNYYNGLASNVSLTCTFGDSVLEDTEKEFQRRLQMVSAGLLTKEKFIAWYFGCDEKEAFNYIPQSSELFGGGA